MVIGPWLGVKVATAVGHPSDSSLAAFGAAFLGLFVVMALVPETLGAAPGKAPKETGSLPPKQQKKRFSPLAFLWFFRRGGGDGGTASAGATILAVTMLVINALKMNHDMRLMVLSTDIGLSGENVSIYYQMRGVFYAMSGPWAKFMIGRFGVTRHMHLACVTAVLHYLAFATAGDDWGWLALVAALDMFASQVTAPIKSAVVDHGVAKGLQRGEVAAMAASMSLIGTALGPGMCALAYARGGQLGTYSAIAALMALCYAAYLTGVRLLGRSLPGREPAGQPAVC